MAALVGEGASDADFKGFDAVTTYMDVVSGEDTLKCATTNNCRVTYRWSYTPMFYYLSPPIMYHGMDVNLYINPTNAPGYKRADQMAADITLDGYRFLTTDYTTDYNLSKNKLNGLRGTVLSGLRTNEAELDIWFRGAGYAMRNEKSSTTCNWDGTDCYFARIYPQINSISETAGSVHGG